MRNLPHQHNELLHLPKCGEHLCMTGGRLNFHVCDSATADLPDVTTHSTTVLGLPQAKQHPKGDQGRQIWEGGWHPSVHGTQHLQFICHSNDNRELGGKLI